MTKTKEPLSTCCNAPLRVGSNDSEESPEGQTHYYVCSKCGKECSAIARINGKEAILSREQEKEMKKTLNEVYGKEVYPQEEEGKKMIPCDCPKGGMYENANGQEIVCPKCHGNEWIEESTPNPEETEEWKEKIKKEKWFQNITDAFGDTDFENQEDCLKFISSLLSQKDKGLCERIDELKNYYNPIGDERNKGIHFACDKIKELLK